VGFAEPDREPGNQYRLTYWTEDLHALAVVPLTATPGSPEQQARAMYDFLLATPTASWPITHRAGHH